MVHRHEDTIHYVCADSDRGERHNSPLLKPFCSKQYVNINGLQRDILTVGNQLLAGIFSTHTHTGNSKGNEQYVQMRIGTVCYLSGYQTRQQKRLAVRGEATTLA